MKKLPNASILDYMISYNPKNYSWHVYIPGVGVLILILLGQIMRRLSTSMELFAMLLTSARKQQDNEITG